MFDIAAVAVTLFVSRLMMDPMSGLNRGYAFITFTTREEALEAVKQVPHFDPMSTLKNLDYHIL